MDETQENEIRAIVREEIAKVYANRTTSTAPDCPFCDSSNTHWMGGNRMICRACKKTKTIKLK